MSDLITQVLELKEVIVLILGLGSVYWKLDKRITKLEDVCEPFFGKMYEEAVKRVIS